MCVPFSPALNRLVGADRLDTGYDTTNTTNTSYTIRTKEETLVFLIDQGGEASPPSDTLDTPLHYAAAQVLLYLVRLG